MQNQNIYQKILLVLFLVVSILTSCSKDDTTGPDITVTGNSNMELPLGSSYADAGATANDNEDGVVTVNSDASTSNPNVDSTGTYTITYTASDRAGNISIETRTIVIYNEAEVFVGRYDHCVDSCSSGVVSQFDSSYVTISNSVNHLVKISNFASFGNSVTVWATINGNSTDSTINVETGQSLGFDSLITVKYRSESLVITGSPNPTFKVKFGWFDGVTTETCTSYWVK